MKKEIYITIILVPDSKFKEPKRMSYVFFKTETNSIMTFIWWKLILKMLIILLQFFFFFFLTEIH